MGIKMELESSESQSTSTKAVAEGVLNYISQIKQILVVIDTELQNMSGEAIKSLNNFIGELILPYLDSVALVIHEIEESVGKLPTEYTAQVDSKSWSEEELQSKIDACETRIRSLQAKIDNNKVKSSDSDKTKDKKKELKKSLEKTQEAEMAKAETYYELLEKLRDYDGNSAGFFSEVSEYKKVSNQGKIAIAGGYNSETKQYELPKDNKEWQHKVQSNTINELSADIEENTGQDETIFKYLSGNYVDYTEAGYATIKDFFTNHGAFLISSAKSVQENAIVSSKYQEDLLQDVIKAGTKAASIGEALDNAYFFKHIGKLAPAIDYISERAKGGTVGEATVKTGISIGCGALAGTILGSFVEGMAAGISFVAVGIETFPVITTALIGFGTISLGVEIEKN